MLYVHLNTASSLWSLPGLSAWSWAGNWQCRAEMVKITIGGKRCRLRCDHPLLQLLLTPKVKPLLSLSSTLLLGLQCYPFYRKRNSFAMAATELVECYALIKCDHQQFSCSLSMCLPSLGFCCLLSVLSVSKDVPTNSNRIASLWLTAGHCLFIGIQHSYCYKSDIEDNAITHGSFTLFSR